MRRRATGAALPSLLEHVDHIERHVEQHGPDEATVRLSLTDDVFLRSSTWARWQLGIPVPVEGRIRGACAISPAWGVTRAS